MIPLYEKYRPRHFGALIGQTRARTMLRTIAKRGFGGRAYWFSGPSASGKTSAARILANKVAAPACIVEYDCADSFNLESARKLGAEMYTFGYPPQGGRAYIINEAHGLRAPVIRELLGILERLPAHAAIIFTTTKIAQAAMFDDAQIDAQPLLSRCVVIPFTSEGLAPKAAPILRRAAIREGLDGKPESAYLAMLRKPTIKNNLRAAWQVIESGGMLAD